MMIAVFERAGISDAAASAQLLIVIVTVGIVATSYTMLGGLRAVIWTDVAQSCY